MSSWAMPAARAAGPEAPKAARPAAQATGPLQVPEGAERLDSLTWRYKEASGKVWIYRRTPFGLVRYEESSRQPEKKPSVGSPALRAFDEGDRIRFEREGPFGKYTWYRQKGAALSAEEQQAWEKAGAAESGTPRASSKASAGQPAGDATH